MVSLRSTKRRSVTDRRRLRIVRLVVMGLVVVLALAFGFVAAMLTPRVDRIGWNAATAADRILANNPGGCAQAPPAPAGTPQFNPPIRAQIAGPGRDGKLSPCRLLIGPRWITGTPDEQRGVKGTHDVLQVQMDGSNTPASSSRLTPFLITFIAALITGTTMLLIPQWLRRAADKGPTTRSQTRSMVTQSGGYDSHDTEIWPETTPQKSPSPPPARRVELPALTTSGVSGLTVDRGSSGAFDVYAATQVGLQHAKDGHTREDAYAIGGAPDIGWVFLAVADGLGSAENSHAAAQLAAQTAVKLLRQRVPDVDAGRLGSAWTAVAPKIVAEIAAALDAGNVQERARQLGYEPGASNDTRRSSPACTLIFAGLGPASYMGYPLLWGCIGDTELILVDLDTGRQHWLTRNATKQAGGMISNVTRALPADYQHVTSGYEDVLPNSMTVLASDGMADAIRQEPRQYAELLPQVAGPSPREWMFGELVGFDLPGLHDDRTIVAAWPRRLWGKTR
jgi:serine/threonine protein phosphatase PrpC